MDKRERVTEAMFTRFGEIMRFQATLPCSAKSSWLAPKPGRLMGMNPRSALSEYRAESVLAVEKISSTRAVPWSRSEEHTSELQSRGHLVCRLLLEKKKQR